MRAKRAKLHLREAELEESNAELAAGNTEPLNLDRVKAEFVATASHELRAPLTL